MQTATNPQTGEKVQWNGSAWVPLGSAESSPAPTGGPVYGPPPAAPKPAGPPSGYVPNPSKPGALTFQEGGPADPYRPGGELDPNKPAGAGNKDTSTEQKGLSFTQRALSANQAYEATGMGPRSITSNVIHEIAPSFQKQYLPEALGGDSSKRQIADANQLAFVNAVLRSDSGANAPEQEVDRYVQQFFPQPGETDPAVIAAKRQLRMDAIEGLKATAGPLAAQLGAAEQQGGGQVVLDAPHAESAPISSGGTHTEADPAAAGANAQLNNMLKSGASNGEIVAYLRSIGADSSSLFAIMQQVAKVREFQKSQPNYTGDYQIDVERHDVPNSALNDIAGSAAGAGAANFANSLTAGIPAALAGDEGRAAISAMQAQHPVASTAGALAGTVGGALGGEALLAARGVAPGVGRALTADTGYGAVSGAAGAEDGNRLSGALTGAVAAGAGSLGGQAVMKGLGTAISPTGGSLADLYQAGVRPTIGQRALAAGDGKGLSGLMGRATNATEEGLSSVPIVGSAIRGARQDARDQFQLGAYNLALKDIGQQLPKGMKVGTAPYGFTKKAFDNAYDKARSGMQVAPDQQLADDIGALGGQITNLAEPSVKRFESIIKNVVLRRAGNTIDGEGYKKIQSELGNTIRGIRKSQSGDGELADALENLQGILDSAARRHSDPEAVKLLDATDAGYAKFVRIRDAAKARGGGAGEFSPTQFDRSVQRNTSGKHSDAYLRGEALMQDYADQGMSLVDRQPNSGTADRLMVGAGAAGGAAYLEPSALGVLGLIGSLYAPGVRKVTAGAMAPRGGPAAKALAGGLRKRARIAGAVGAGAALSAQKDDDR